MLTFGLEKWGPFFAEAKPLMDRHWEEIALDKDLFKADMDSERYQAMEDIGMLHILAARRETALIGYAIFFIMPHFHYKSSGLLGMADMYWIAPEHRTGGCGAKLLIEAEKSLRERGVIKAHISCKVHQNHSALFERLGWENTDLTFSKVLVERQSCLS